jgi:hypothetical protein
MLALPVEDLAEEVAITWVVVRVIHIRVEAIVSTPEFVRILS